MLVDLERVDVIVALLIIGREIAISSLREWMALIGAAKSVAVNLLGKLKTTFQMVAIPFLLFDGVLWGWLNTAVYGTIMIWMAAILTIGSMFYYLKKAIPHIRAAMK